MSAITNPHEDPMANKQAEAGDNIKAENERKALFFHHARKRMAHDADLDQVKNDRKLDGKIAQADGFVLDDIDYAIKAMSAEDKSTISDSYVRHGEILEWLGMIPSFQPDMFRDRMPAVERREKQGELAGLANKPRESGFAKNSEDDQAWLRGFDRGQAIFNQNIGSALEQAEQKRQAGKTELIKRRGRPPKNASAAGQPIEGETPDDAKAADKAEEKPAAAAATNPPKPPKPDKPAKPAGKAEEEMTNSEREALAQARAMFIN
ncbi:hypothetical protein [Mesorhizobium sp. B2-1-2]|uniref:hypothetical protein n=1 Tax=Mesorhizobium sp. B2-1-2 TaxID=2589973 RepID=UPI00112D1489|nr:hypothetical protein [Mesorhizobium sp. B2-1-2]TPN11693.1 hypothetical protein FJ971_09805 [Mesorhizobium sp. B2-1-2]